MREVLYTDDLELDEVRGYIRERQAAARILRGVVRRAQGAGALEGPDMLLYARARLADPLLPEAERQRLRQVLLVGTAANRRERRAAIRQVRRERVAPKRRKHEARGRRAYLRAMSARHEGV